MKYILTAKGYKEYGDNTLLYSRAYQCDNLDELIEWCRALLIDAKVNRVRVVLKATEDDTITRQTGTN